MRFIDFGRLKTRFTSKVKDNQKSIAAFLVSSFEKRKTPRLSWALASPVCAVYRAILLYQPRQFNFVAADSITCGDFYVNK